MFVDYLLLPKRKTFRFPPSACLQHRSTRKGFKVQILATLKGKYLKDFDTKRTYVLTYFNKYFRSEQNCKQHDKINTF